ncbi:helix-turn-helix transcriptional regulator, partial [Vibrio cholerae O1]|nr:helix-turn-helix transcriptional regulator [Vibrio cholerae O1]
MKTEKKRLTREESQQQTREQLLETARQLFVAGGYGGTSIRDIASQAGYSQGAFYSNFASKEALLLQLLQR